MSTISIQEIESTKAWQGLNKIQKSFAVKRANRLLIQNALIVHKSTGVIPTTVFGYNSSIVNELIIGELAKNERIESLKKIGTFGIDEYNESAN